tara:strand:- start:2636 stop:3169 length:534 start_codon:yes stop_codon:yes gene_type:complete
MILNNYFNKINMPDGFNLNETEFREIYGKDYQKFISKDLNQLFVFSKDKKLDLVELDMLLKSVGWSQRPMRRVKRALDFSILVVGIWKHDERFPRLVGFARCTGDGVVESTIWDVAVSPIYQGLGLGKELMNYILKSLKKTGISKVTLFADPGVISFYKRQGWTLEPKSSKCAFWYA